MRRTKAVLCSMAFLPAAAGCFSERDGITDAAPEFVSCSASAPAPPANARVVRIRNFQFSPAQLTVPAGTTVWWINCEDAGPSNAHTATSDTGLWDSNLLEPQGSGYYSRTFSSTGSFPYHCTPHPNMTGTITVS